MRSDPKRFRTRTDPIQGKYDVYSSEYRRLEMNTLAHKIGIRECISLVGVGTVGKTHFLKNFFAPDVLSSSLSAHKIAAADVISVIIDPNALLNMEGDGATSDVESGWSGFELITAQIMRAIPPAYLPKEVKDAYGEIIAPEPFFRATAFRHLQNAINAIFNTLGPKRLLIIFDEFERLLRIMPASFFINLRALRDEKRYELLYMTLSRKEIYNLAQGHEDIQKKMNEAQSFFELFKDPIYLRAAEEGDCIELVRGLNARVRSGRLLSWDNYDLITQLVNGHAGLIRTALLIFDEIGNYGKSQDFGHHLLNNPNIQQECDILLESCTPREVIVLQALMEAEQRKTPVGPDFERTYFSELHTLYQKHLLNVGTAFRYTVTPPILFQYLYFRAWYQAHMQRYIAPSNPRPNGPKIPPPEPPKTMPR